MQLGHYPWKPIARSPDMYYHTGWYSSAICNNNQESLWASLAGKVKEENDCCFGQLWFRDRRPIYYNFHSFKI